MSQALLVSEHTTHTQNIYVFMYLSVLFICIHTFSKCFILTVFHLFQLLELTYMYQTRIMGHPVRKVTNLAYRWLTLCCGCCPCPRRPFSSVPSRSWLLSKHININIFNMLSAYSVYLNIYLSIIYIHTFSWHYKFFSSIYFGC